MKIFQCFYLFILVLTTQASTATSLLKGQVHRQDGQLILTMAESGQQYPLLTHNPHVMNDLSKLENGDYLSGKGQIHKSKDVVEVTAVEFVGLYKMLGVWYTQDWKVFDFKNFSQLDLHFSVYSQKNNKVFLHNLRYTVAPKDGSGWSILIVGSNSVNVGNLYIQQNSMRIEVFDPKTGYVAKTIDLFSFTIGE